VMANAIAGLSPGSTRELVRAASSADDCSANAEPSLQVGSVGEKFLLTSPTVATSADGDTETIPEQDSVGVAQSIVSDEQWTRALSPLPSSKRQPSSAGRILSADHFLSPVP
jgi:hypothetical protein